jgi:hypothetical protein
LLMLDASRVVMMYNVYDENRPDNLVTLYQRRDHAVICPSNKMQSQCTHTRLLVLRVAGLDTLLYVLVTSGFRSVRTD